MMTIYRPYDGFKCVLFRRIKSRWRVDTNKFVCSRFTYTRIKMQIINWCDNNVHTIRIRAPYKLDIVRIVATQFLHMIRVLSILTHASPSLKDSSLAFCLENPISAFSPITTVETQVHQIGLKIEIVCDFYSNLVVNLGLNRFDWSSAICVRPLSKAALVQEDEYYWQRREKRKSDSLATSQIGTAHFQVLSNYIISYTTLNCLRCSSLQSLRKIRTKDPRNNRNVSVKKHVILVEFIDCVIHRYCLQRKSTNRLSIL